MSFGDPFEFVDDLPDNSYHAKGPTIYMVEFMRTVICPNGTLVFINPTQISPAFKDLQTWGLSINPFIMDQ